MRDYRLPASDTGVRYIVGTHRDMDIGANFFVLVKDPDIPPDLSLDGDLDGNTILLNDLALIRNTRMPRINEGEGRRRPTKRRRKRGSNKKKGRKAGVVKVRMW